MDYHQLTCNFESVKLRNHTNIFHAKVTYWRRPVLRSQIEACHERRTQSRTWCHTYMPSYPPENPDSPGTMLEINVSAYQRLKLWTRMASQTILLFFLLLFVTMIQQVATKVTNKEFLEDKATTCGERWNKNELIEQRKKKYGRNWANVHIEVEDPLRYM